MNEYRARIQQAIGKAEEPLRLLQSGKLDRKTALTLIHKLDWKKAAVVALGTAAVASAVSLAAQRRFYQGIVSRELKRQLGPLREQLDEIVDILLETVCTNRKSIRVAGDDYPAELVKAKFLKLDSHHIEFVMDCLRDNTTKVRNIKQYLRAMLFNAPSTINSYYASLVAHDMAQPDWGRPPNT
mgnify:CR=1 FL=1